MCDRIRHGTNLKNRKEDENENLQLKHVVETIKEKDVVNYHH